MARRSALEKGSWALRFVMGEQAVVYEKGYTELPMFAGLEDHRRELEAPRVIDFKPGESMLAAELLVAPKATCPHRLCSKNSAMGTCAAETVDARKSPLLPPELPPRLSRLAASVTPWACNLP